MIFAAFGKILVLANVFFYSKSNEKVLKNSFFKLLARSWFWQMLFAIQNCKLKSIEKIVVILAFGKILVLVNAFLHQNLHQNHVLLSFLFGLGHELLFK